MHPALRALYINQAETIPFPPPNQRFLLQLRSNHNFQVQVLLNISLRDKLPWFTKRWRRRIHGSNTTLCHYREIRYIRFLERLRIFITHAGCKDVYIRTKGALSSIHRKNETTKNLSTFKTARDVVLADGMLYLMTAFFTFWGTETERGRKVCFPMAT